MILDKFRYGFLSRMLRPEGLPPQIKRDLKHYLGASPPVIFEASLAVSIFCCIITFVFFPSGEGTGVAADAPQEFVQFEDIEQTKQENRPPPPPRPPIPIEAPSDEAIEDVDLVSTEIDVSADVAPPPSVDGGAEDEYFVAVEDMPQPIGGIGAIQRSVVYPEIAQRAGVQGRVYVLAYVNESGEVTKAEIQRDIGAGCGQAAVNAVLKAKFIPGKQRGKPVKVRVSIPIRFQLTEN